MLGVTLGEVHRSRTPEDERAYLCDVAEVVVRSQHRQVVLQAELRVERVDRLDLNTSSSTRRAEIGGSDVRRAIRNEQRQGREGTENTRPSSGTPKSLE